MKHHEEEMQIQCVQWFRYQYPNKIIIAIPNGGTRQWKINSKGIKYSPEAQRLKRMGVTKGVPDLFIPEPARWPSGIVWHGLWIELKVGRNKTTPEQEKFIQEMNRRFYDATICRSFDDFIKVVREYFKTT